MASTASAKSESESESLKKRIHILDEIIRERARDVLRARAAKKKIRARAKALLQESGMEIGIGRPRPKIVLSGTREITEEDEIFMEILRLLAHEDCSIMVVVYMHGIINPDLPLITAPEGMCVTLTRTAPAGCVAVEDTTIPIFKDISPQEIRYMLMPGERAEALARRSRTVFKHQQELVSKFLTLENIDADFKNVLDSLDKKMLKTKGKHCNAVTCVPDQLFYDKWYHRDTGNTVEKIEVINSELTRGVDIMSLMIKHGFGTRQDRKFFYETKYESITRNSLFKFFKSLGINNLTLFDTACSTVGYPLGEKDLPPDFDVAAYIGETEARGALGGTSRRKKNF